MNSRNTRQGVDVPKDSQVHRKLSLPPSSWGTWDTYRVVSWTLSRKICLRSVESHGSSPRELVLRSQHLGTGLKLGVVTSQNRLRFMWGSSTVMLGSRLHAGSTDFMLLGPQCLLSPTLNSKVWRTSRIRVWNDNFVWPVLYTRISLSMQILLLTN